ncbi:MAG: hypothetical protein KBD78_12510 [Oligoflexales bacterium]|nr:hypothetical protein [Oligoflexales bacterium]
MYKKKYGFIWFCLASQACLQSANRSELVDPSVSSMETKAVYAEQLPSIDESAESKNAHAQFKAINLVEDDCLSFQSQNLKLPAYLANPPLIMTSVDKACLTIDGENGYRKDSNWTALSIPCTAGNGRIDVKGSPYSPKQVRFLFHVSCPAVGNEKDAIQSLKSQKSQSIHLGSLTIIHPLMVQYWEIIDADMHGIGQFIALDSPSALQKIWKNFYLNKHRIKINVYGRENSWNAKDLFKITGEIYLSAEKKFTFLVDKVEALNSTEIALKKRECLQNNQLRECENIF